MINFRQLMGQLKRMGINVKQINAKEILTDTLGFLLITKNPKLIRRKVLTKRGIE